LCNSHHCRDQPFFHQGTNKWNIMSRTQNSSLWCPWSERLSCSYSAAEISVVVSKRGCASRTDSEKLALFEIDNGEGEYVRTFFGTLLWVWNKIRTLPAAIPQERVEAKSRCSETGGN
jgi:hypothetical protein